MVDCCGIGPEKIMDNSCHICLKRHDLDYQSTFYKKYIAWERYSSHLHKLSNNGNSCIHNIQMNTQAPNGRVGLHRYLEKSKDTVWIIWVQPDLIVNWPDASFGQFGPSEVISTRGSICGWVRQILFHVAESYICAYMVDLCPYLVHMYWAHND